MSTDTTDNSLIGTCHPDDGPIEATGHGLVARCGLGHVTPLLPGGCFNRLMQLKTTVACHSARMSRRPCIVAYRTEVPISYPHRSSNSSCGRRPSSYCGAKASRTSPGSSKRDFYLQVPKGSGRRYRSVIEAPPCEDADFRSTRTNH